MTIKIKLSVILALTLFLQTAVFAQVETEADAEHFSRGGMRKAISLSIGWALSVPGRFLVF